MRSQYAAKNPREREALRQNYLNNSDFVFEPKYNGYWVMIVCEEGVVKLKTKIIKTHSGFSSLPQALEVVFTALRIRNIILDSELMYLDKTGHGSDSTVAKRLGKPYLYLFDFLYINGWEVWKLPLVDCRIVLEEFYSHVRDLEIKQKSLVSLVPQFVGTPRLKSKSLEKSLNVAKRVMCSSMVIARTTTLRILGSNLRTQGSQEDAHGHSNNWKLVSPKRTVQQFTFLNYF